MSLKKTLRFLWLLFTARDTEDVRQAEIEAKGGGMGTYPPGPHP